MHSSRSEDLREFLSSVNSRKLHENGQKFVVPFNRGESVSSCIVFVQNYATFGNLIWNSKLDFKIIIHNYVTARLNTSFILQTFSVEYPKQFQLPSIPENVSINMDCRLLRLMLKFISNCVYLFLIVFICVELCILDLDLY